MTIQEIPSARQLLLELPKLCKIGYKEGGAASLDQVSGLIELTIVGGPAPPENALEWRERQEALRSVLKAIASQEIRDKLGEQYEIAALRLFRLDLERPLSVPEHPSLTEVQEDLNESFGKTGTGRDFIKKHRPAILEVTAKSLTERERAARLHAKQNGGKDAPVPEVDEVSLLQTKPHFIDIYRYLHELDPNRFCGLLAKLAATFEEFTRAIEHIYRATERGNYLSARYSRPIEQPDATDYYRSLHILARRGFTRAERVVTDGPTLSPTRMSLSSFLVDAFFQFHSPDPLSSYVWLGRTMAILEENFLPHYTLREQDLLRHAAQEADDNLHVFLYHLEVTEHGRAVLESWKAALTLECPQEPPWVSDKLAAINYSLYLIERIRKTLYHTRSDTIEIAGLAEFVDAFESKHLRKRVSEHLDAGHTYPGTGQLGPGNEGS